MSFLFKNLKKNVRTIRFNRPERKNAMNSLMYEEMDNILRKDATDNNVVITIITGAGEYFSSGYDLKSATNTRSINDMLGKLSNMVETFINYPKILIAVVNGPAFGIGATLPALCDIVYASDKAFFDTPFVKLGICIEAAASFTFPVNLGRSKASEIICLNHRLSAEEAYKFGLISNIIPHSQIDNFIEMLHRHGDLPVDSVIVNKKLLMDNFKNRLIQSADREIKELNNCIKSSEFLEIVTAFVNRKNKL